LSTVVNAGERIAGAAGAAAAAWSEVSLASRAERLRRLRLAIVERLDDVADAVRRDAGKVRAEALLTDLLPTLEVLLYNEKNAERVLSPEERPGSLIFPGTRAKIRHEPWGVVLAIAPWNNPFQLSLLPAATALLAGNAVVIKPSERSPAVSAVLRDLFAAAGFAPDLAQVVEGGPEAATELVEAGPDLVCFTGGVRGGKAVYRLCAERMIPAITELGGKDAMIVFADADLDRAARGAVYGAFAHDGQHCISVERLYVEKSIYEDFVAQVVKGASQLRRAGGKIGDADLSARPDPAGEKRVREQIEEALGHGARLLTSRAGESPTLPAVLADVPQDSALMREETFGPVLASAPFADEDEAVRLANGCDFGLNASVWTADDARAARVTARMQSGCVCVNNVLVNAGHPALPFGGVGKSGFGRYHGPEGLLAFTRSKAVVDQRKAGSSELHWFPYDRELEDITEELIRLRYGSEGGLLDKGLRWLRLAGSRSAHLRRLKEEEKPGE